MVTVGQLIEIANEDGRVRIIKEGEQIYIGAIWKLKHYDNIYSQIQDRPVKKIRAELEIRHKGWEEKGLMAPLEPEHLAKYQYGDMREELYYNLQI
jgi:hypothetical protein